VGQPDQKEGKQDRLQEGEGENAERGASFERGVQGRKQKGANGGKE